MRPARLSMRLGLTVGAMCTLLVILMAALAYLAIAHQLDVRARQSLDDKLAQIEHSLAPVASLAQLRAMPQRVEDQILGHDNFSLDIRDAASAQVPTLVMGALKTAHGHEVMARTRLVRLHQGQQVLVSLFLDRENDARLLSAYVGSMFLALPLLLLLVGASAWWVVHRGLRPLRSFRKVAARISAQDLSHRMVVEGLPEELADLARGFNFMLSRLDGDVQQLARFSDDLAHELRSPMNNLMGKAQVTLSRERPPGEYKAVLESCTEELERLSRMVSQMLFLASVTQPQAPLALARLDVREEAERVAELFAASAEDRQVVLQLSGSGHVQGDRLMLQRALSNLLSNAIRHSPAGATVSIQLEHEQSALRVTVSNAGEGIAPEHLPHVFERFYRVQASRSREDGGTGLGLAIVRSIMQLHKGRVEVDSQPGVRTRFRLLFQPPA